MSIGLVATYIHYAGMPTVLTFELSWYTYWVDTLTELVHSLSVYVQPLSSFTFWGGTPPGLVQDRKKRVCDLFREICSSLS